MMCHKECENCGKPSGLAKLCPECAAKKKAPAAPTAETRKEIYYQNNNTTENIKSQ